MVATHESVEEAFDATGFIEGLRIASVADQKKMDGRYVWTDKGVERSGYPQQSQECLRQVSIALKQNPSQAHEVLHAVDKFLDQSIGLDRINLLGVAKRGDDAFQLSLGTSGKAEFFKRLSAMLVQQPPAAVVTSDASVPESGTADEVKALIPEVQ